MPHHTSTSDYFRRKHKDKNRLVFASTGTVYNPKVLAFPSRLVYDTIGALPVLCMTLPERLCDHTINIWLLRSILMETRRLHYKIEFQTYPPGYRSTARYEHNS